MKRDPFPILTLRYDTQAEQWMATYDESSQGYPYGAGNTPQEAVAEAIRQIKNRKDEEMNDEITSIQSRKITEHQVNPANDKLVVEVLDAPGAGGANHLYFITGFNTKTNPSDPFAQRHGSPAEHSTILFQNGPIPENGTNGLTHEVLLAIIADRLRSFQAGPYKCGENEDALHAVEQAMKFLKSRTTKRMDRGVEGTHTV